MARQVILTEGSDNLITEGSDFIITEAAEGPFAWNGHLGPARAPARDPRRKAHPDLRPPIVVGAAQQGFHGPGVRLAESLSTRNQQGRREAKSFLRPPQVLTPSATFTPCARVTDNFTRANENPIRGIWSDASTAQLLSNTLQPAATGGTAFLRQAVNVLAPWQLSIKVSDYGSVAPIQIGVNRASGVQRAWINIDVDTGTVTLFVFGSNIGSTVRTLTAGDEWALVGTPSGANTTYDVFHKPFGGSFQLILTSTNSLLNWATEPTIVPVVSVGDDFDPAAISEFSFCPYVNDGVAVTSTYSRRGRPRSFYSQLPVVQQLAPQGGILIQYVQPPRPFRKTMTRLRPPAVLTQPAIFTGPEAKLAAAPKRRNAKSRLTRVVYAPRAYDPIAGYLAPPRSTRPKTRSRLSPPAVVYSDANRGILGKLAYSRRGKAKSFLRPALGSRAPEAVYLSINLAPSARQGRRATYDLAAPFVIDAELGVMGGTEPVLARSSRGRPKSFLRPPVVVTAATLAAAVKVELTYSRRGRAKSRLLPVPSAFRPVGVLEVKLAPSKRGRPKSILRKPTVIDLRPQVYYLATTFARIRPQPIHSVLRRPTDVVDQADLGFVRVHLAPQRRGIPKSRLPEVVYDARVYEPIAGYLVPPRSTRPPVRSRLSPPAAVSYPATGELRVTLVRIRPVPTDASVFKPIVVAQDQGQQGGIGIQLAPSFRGEPKSKLFPPATVTVVVPLAYPTSVTLAPSSRGKAKSHLSAPAVVYSDVNRGIMGKLAYSRRGRPKSFLRPPVDTVGIEDQGRIRVTLVRIRPVRTRVVLRKPVVVFPFIARPIDTTIARIKPPPVHSILRRPTVIDLRPQVYYVSTTLTYSRRGKPKSFLPQASLYAPVPKAEYQLATTLAYSRRGQPKSILPLVVYDAKVYEPIQGQLAPPRSTVPQSFSRLPQVIYDATVFSGIRGRLARKRVSIPEFYSRLAPPTVVIVVSALARPIDTTFARIRPRRTISRLGEPTVVATESNCGDFARQLGLHQDLQYWGEPFRTQAIAEAVALGATVSRSTLLWNAVETSPGVYDWSSIDDVVDRLLAEGIEPLLVPALFPSWITGFIDQFTLPASSTDRDAAAAAYTSFCRAAALHFLGRVNLWELWNEQNEQFFLSYSTNDAAARTVATDWYANAYRSARWAILGANATAKVAIGGLTGLGASGTPPFNASNWLDRFFLTVPTNEVDFCAIHPYTSSADQAPNVTIPFSQNFTDIGVMRSYFDSHSMSRVVLWITEWGWQSTAPMTPALQASYLETSFQMLRTDYPYVPILCWFLDHDTGTYTHGLYNIDETTIKPAGTSFIALQGTLNNTYFCEEGPVVTLAYSRRGQAKSFLPQVVYDARIYLPIQGQLAPPRAVTAQTSSRLAPPTVVRAATTAPSLSINLTYSRRGKASYDLGGPIVILPNNTFPEGPGVALAYSRRGKATSFLRGPVVLNFNDGFPQGPMVILAPQRRGAPKSKLGRAAVVTPATIAYGPKVKLVRIRPRRTIARLRPPTVVFPFLARPIDVTLARIRPPKTYAILRRPTDIVDQADLGYVRVHLAYSLRGRPKSILRKPVVIDLRPQTYYVSVNLAYSRRGKPRSFLPQASLYQPVPKAEYQLAITLAYQSRGKPKSKLRPPTVVKAATPYFRREPTALVRIRPKRTIWRLAPPTVVFPFRARQLEASLAPQRRGRPKSRLLGVIYGAKVYAPISVTLAPSRFPRPKSILRDPIIPELHARPTQITLAPQRRGVPKPFLRVVIYAARVYAPIKVVLAPSSGLALKAHAHLSAPTVVDYFQARPTKITLAYSLRGRPKSFLRPPQAVRQPELVNYYGPKITLVRNKPRRTFTMLRPFGPTITCYGIVCGVDYGPIVCGSDSGAEVSGGDSGATVSGSDSGATVTGMTGSRGNVSGGDERREGC